MRLFTTIAGLRCYLERLRFCQRPQVEVPVGKESSIQNPLEIGLVPTMGALHPGHLSLIERAKRDNDITIVSIFVNPLQFGPAEDFSEYPRMLERDRQLCEGAEVDVIFAPTVREMGVEHRIATKVVPPESMVSILCGNARVGHFQGVATVVMKLLNICQPQRAYFGQKDAQQLAIIRRLVADLNFAVEIVGCPIVREASGLAYSSRNQYLTSEQRASATVLDRGLRKAEEIFQRGERSRAVLLEAFQSWVARFKAVQLEYLDLVHPDTLIPLDSVEEAGLLACAAYIGSARLIDNTILRNRQPIVAIDGPAGAGKSTISKTVARTLGLLYLDTGAMYRSVTWLVLQLGIPVDDEPSIAEVVSQCEIQLTAEGVRIDLHDVTQAIRSPEVTARVSEIAALPAVRREMVKRQQLWSAKGGIIAEGRDIGTHVFPDAELKIYLTASIEERARRRQQDFVDRGSSDISLEQLEKDLGDRDLKDSNRWVAPLRKAADAIEIQTDNLGIAQVTERIVFLFRQRSLHEGLGN